MSELAEPLTRVLERCIDGFESLQSVERLSGGASQETYRLEIRARGGEQTLALRRAAGGYVREEGVVGPDLTAEAELIRLARKAGVPEPEIFAVLKPEDGIGDGFIMEWLEGEALGARIARADTFADIRPSLSRQAGEILARIHALEVGGTVLDERLTRHNPESSVRQKWESYQSFGTPQPMIDYTARWLLDNLPANPRSTLVHGDFRNGNLMVRPDAGITAVLDWEGAHIGDPIEDLGWLCTNSWRFGVTELPVGGFGPIEDLIAGYEAVSDATVDRDALRFWIVYGSFSWAVGCLMMAEHYRTGPDPSVERPGIGRRTSECQIDCVNLIMPGSVQLVEADSHETAVDMPRTDELLSSVRDFLRESVMSETQGRTSFLARVASNSLDIVLRELAHQPAARAQEQQGLERILGHGGEYAALRWELTQALRDGSLPLDADGLQDYLRNAVANQVAIDQPRYSGLRTAVSGRQDPAMESAG